MILGVVIWAAGWILGLALVPVVNASDLSIGLKATLNGILLLGFPKLFRVLAVAVMGKPGFAYLEVAARFTFPSLRATRRRRPGALSRWV